MSDGFFMRQGRCSTLNITAPTTLQTNQAPFIGGPVARVVRVNVLVAGSTAGSINDTATPAGASAANQVFAIPNTVGSYLVDFPMLNGITVNPGTGQTVAVSYD